MGTFKTEERFYICYYYWGGNNINKIDLTGLRFGKLVVIERTIKPNTNTKKTYWLCKCDCGGMRIACTNELKSGKAIQCAECGRKASDLSRRKDMTGEKFGHLTVLKMIYGKQDKSGKYRTYCECQCDCGKIVTRLADNLDSTKIQSCGCAQKEIHDKQSKDIIGQKFGRLTVIEEIDSCRPRKVVCICDCGNMHTCIKTDIMAGHSQSCGCLQRERTSAANEKDWTGYVSDSGVKAIRQMYKNDKGQWLWEYECPICGCKFVALPARVSSDHLVSCGCQLQSSGERMIKIILEKYNIDFIQQYTFEDCKYKNRLRFDFAIIKDDKVFCLIEYDGKQHFEPIEFFGGIKSFIETQKRDKIKNEFCENNNIPLLRLKYTLTKDEIEKEIANIIYP